MSENEDIQLQKLYRELVLNTDVVIFDVDGVFKTLDRWLRDSVKILVLLKELGIKYVFVSNNPYEAPHKMKEKFDTALSRFNIKVKENMILTPVETSYSLIKDHRDLVASHTKQPQEKHNIYVMGNGYLKEFYQSRSDEFDMIGYREINKAKPKAMQQDMHVDYMVFGWDSTSKTRENEWRKKANAAAKLLFYELKRAVRKGADVTHKTKIYVTSLDMKVPKSSKSLYPGPGEQFEDVLCKLYDYIVKDRDLKKMRHDDHINALNTWSDDYLEHRHLYNLFKDNKRASRSLGVLMAAGLSPTVIGKPEPRTANQALANINMSSKNAMVYGDGATDMGLAKLLGVPAVYVNGAASTKYDELASAHLHPDYSIKSVLSFTRGLAYALPDLKRDYESKYSGRVLDVSAIQSKIES